MNSGGDVLARGGKSAQFSAQTNLTDFEYDVAFREDLVIAKYGITAEELAAYKTQREAGEKLPDLSAVDGTFTPEDDVLNVKFTVTDRRPNYLLEGNDTVAPVKEKKFAEKEFTSFRPILDRLLIKRVATDKNMEMLSDGSMRNKTTGLVIAAKYRQHSNTGIVLAAGDFVIIGGVKVPMDTVVKPGDRVTFGDYNSEVFHMEEERIKSLCDAVELDYEVDEEGLRVVRVQDVRGVERPNGK